MIMFHKLLLPRSRLHNFSSFTKVLKVQVLAFDINVLLIPQSDLVVSVEPGTKQEAVAYDTSQEIPNVHNIQSKYISKLRGKIGGVTELHNKTKYTDGQLMTKIKSLSLDEKSPLQSLLSKDMASVLEYVNNRNIQLALIRSSEDTTLEFADELQHQLVNFNFQYILQDENFGSMEEAMCTDPKNILFISSNDVNLTKAKERGYYTCKYRYLESSSTRGCTKADFLASNPLEIQDCLEELIGVSMIPTTLKSRRCI